ncbi:MAG: hypothetical protein Q9218_005725 [Villophora microphyllina]
MAILGSLRAELHVDGQPLQEYQVPNTTSDNRNLTKYVEAPTGKAFGIYVSVPEEYHMTSERIEFKFIIDGQKIRKKILNAGEEDVRYAANIRTQDNSGIMELRPFVFTDIEFAPTWWQESRLSVTSNEFTAGALLRYGTIVVKAFRVDDVVQVVSSHTHSLMRPLKTTHTELRDLGITQSVTFGEPLRSEASGPALHAAYKDGRDSPIATFILKYRTKETLELLRVKPFTNPILKAEEEGQLSIEQCGVLDRGLELWNDEPGVAARRDIITRRSARLSQERDFTPGTTVNSAEARRDYTHGSLESVSRRSASPMLPEPVPGHLSLTPTPRVPISERSSSPQTPIGSEPIPGPHSFLLGTSNSTPRSPARLLKQSLPAVHEGLGCSCRLQTAPEPIAGDPSVSPDPPEPIHGSLTTASAGPYPMRAVFRGPPVLPFHRRLLANNPSLTSSSAVAASTSVSKRKRSSNDTNIASTGNGSEAGDVNDQDVQEYGVEEVEETAKEKRRKFDKGKKDGE